MKEETRIKIELDADENVMDRIKGEVVKHLRKIEDLYDEFGVFNVKIVPLNFSRGELDWRKTE